MYPQNSRLFHSVLAFIAISSGLPTPSFLIASAAALPETDFR
jgi:hypothetical protein